ncbi:MAG: glycosyltransferase [Coriobacteriales bacterium]|nr:glycosyltransferase [Coriobacteriales bacterium]
MPVISLLVPVYNVERYLRACLDSAANQTCSDIEIICINDGSTDSSRQIIQEYLNADDRFRVIDKPNTGYDNSMNCGLDEAKGDYIAILESDDIMYPGSLEALLKAAEDHDAQVAKGPFNFYWSAPEERDEFFWAVPEDQVGQVVNPVEQPQIFYLKPSIWSALYRADFLRDNGIRFLETPGASYQDAGFNFKVWACADRVTFIGEPILRYRQDNEASSVNSSNKVFCVYDEYDEMERFLRAHPLKRKQLESVKNRMKFDSYLWNYDRLSKDLRVQFLARASKELASDIRSGVMDMNLSSVSEEADVRAMAFQPDAFADSRGALAQPGKLNTLRRYYRLGGLPLVGRLVASKLKGCA